jgi:uncharacterized SAM-binding protein YcdF (DUF218 family)
MFFQKQLLFMLFSALLNSCVFFGPSGKKLYTKAVSKKPYDVIIVPGAPYDSLKGNWSMPMKARIYWSKHLFETGIAKNIIFSGSAVYTPYVESKVMALYAAALGIPPQNIFVETKAEHSTENIYYSYQMARKLGFEKIAIATDPLQARLLRSYPRRIKIKADFIPMVIDSLKTMDKKDFIKIDTESAKVKDFVSIVDRENRFKRFWGTLGKNIKK